MISEVEANLNANAAESEEEEKKGEDDEFNKIFGKNTDHTKKKSNALIDERSSSSIDSSKENKPTKKKPNKAKTLPKTKASKSTAKRTDTI